MKRIISIICTLALLVSMVSTLGIVANAGEKITAELTYSKVMENKGTHYLFLTLKTNLPAFTALKDDGDMFSPAFNGKVLKAMAMNIKTDSTKLEVFANGGTSPDVTNFAKPSYNSQQDYVSVAYAGGASAYGWYSGAAPEFTICYKVLDDDYVPEFTLDTTSAVQIVTWDNAEAETGYATSDYIVGGTDDVLELSVGEMKSYNQATAPAVPTAKDYGLFTDASQNFKVTAPVMTSNEYAIEKALGFVSGINENVELACGTEITCEGFENVLDIPAANFYEAADNVKGFVAAVTSIRDTNLDKKFSAKAYVVVDGKKVYAEETATAVYGK